MEAIVTTAHEMGLVERARQGDIAAFESLLRRYERQIYGFTYRMMAANAADADDLTQETFIKAYRALPQTREMLHVSAWLHRIAANCCRDELRRRRRTHCQPWDPAMHEPAARNVPEEDPELLVLQKEADEWVQAILDRMKPRNKQALMLREYMGMSCEEIGAVMGVSHKAIKSTLFRARDEFRDIVAAIG
ncbi:MAG: sigma-70 family RNA polymerase sigma factor [Thermomicrobia bacterium]|nr:sigma-70 family RNA polymerase sigma factor [Thermomicrobia bacterium]MCA1723896.1 sigma-70 family RNA polymerase sigma factor [Thermomicrobia bacterium]